MIIPDKDSTTITTIQKRARKCDDKNVSLSPRCLHTLRKIKNVK